MFSFVCIQASEVRVNFVVMRPAETQEEGGSSREGQHSRAARRPEPQYFRRRSTYMKVRLNVAKTNAQTTLYIRCFIATFI